MSPDQTGPDQTGPDQMSPDQTGPDQTGRLSPACAAVDDDLAELALGTLAGRGRVAVLAHLEVCARCSAEVEALSAAADHLLQLAPPAEPPVGFEAGIFERAGKERRAPGLQGRRWPTRRAVAVAACAAVLLAFGAGSLVGHSVAGRSVAGHSVAGRSVAGHSVAGRSVAGRSVAGPGGGATGPANPIEVTSFVSDGHSVGRVMVYAGNPTWLFMYVDDPAWQGTLACEIVQDQGPSVVLGHFWLSGGKGAWAASVSEPAGRLLQARVLSASGKVLAVAPLP